MNEENNEPMPMGQLIRTAHPPLYFIVVVVAGKYLNNMLFGGYHVFTPPFNMITTIVLATILTKSSIDNMAENLVQGSSFILTRLFTIGVFLGFINILSEIGTFKYIAQIAASAPPFVFVSTAILAGFIVAIPTTPSNWDFVLADINTQMGCIQNVTIHRGTSSWDFSFMNSY